MSQECWYSSHLRHTDEFYPCIRPGLKKRKENNTSHQPRTSYINVDIQRKKIISFCSMVITSGKTDCFTLCEKSEHKSRGVPPIMASTGKIRPDFERGTSSRLQVYERVRILIVEVYERVEKSVSFWSVKGPKRANRRILCL